VRVVSSLAPERPQSNGNSNGGGYDLKVNQLEESYGRPNVQGELPGGQKPTRAREQAPIDLIGNTPLVDISCLSANPDVRIFAKCEYTNPSGSIKDRMAKHIIERAEQKGDLAPGATICCASSGNSGAAFALVAAMRGYQCKIITNTKTSAEKVQVMRAYGGDVTVTRGGVPADHPEHYQNIELKLCEENSSFFSVNQYGNPDNPAAYYHSLGPEIWQQTQGRVTHFVAGASTGGTVSGTAQYLKDQGDVKAVIVDPVGSVLWEYFARGVPADELKASKYEVEGVGKDSIPDALDTSIVDAIIQATDKDAFDMCKRLSETGVLAGGSSGLNVHGAVELSKRLDSGCIVTVLPDSGLKYLSKVYNEEWLEEKGLSGETDPMKERMDESAVGSPPTNYVELKPSQEMQFDYQYSSDSDTFLESSRLVVEQQQSADPVDDFTYVESRNETQFLEKAADLLVGYAGSQLDARRPTNTLRSPAELEEAFRARGHSIEIGDGEGPASEDEVLRAMDVTLKYSVRTGHPLFLNQLYSGSDPYALAGDWLSVAANTNVHTYEVAPVFTLIEKAVLDKIARVWLGADGDGSTKPHEGLFVAGGSMANLYSVILARHRAAPMARMEGMTGKGRLVGFCSDQCHYSYQKAAAVAGIGIENMIKVKTDAKGAMIPAELEAAVQKCLADGAQPFYIGATAGTTVLGAYDPLGELADIAEKYSMWLHCDGAWGGSAIVSQKHKEINLKDVHKADSFAWSPHKMLNMALQCSVIMTRHPGLMMEANGYEAAYLFQPDKLNADQDLGKKTISCGRKSDAYKLWLAWKAKGDQGIEADVDRAFDIAHCFVNAIKNSKGAFVLASEPQCTNVCFWYVPKHLRPLDISAATEEQKEELQQVAPKIKAKMQEAGDALIGFQTNRGLPNFFRIVFPGARGLDESDIFALLKRMKAYGDDL